MLLSRTLSPLDKRKIKSTYKKVNTERIIDNIVKKQAVKETYKRIDAERKAVEKAKKNKNF